MSIIDCLIVSCSFYLHHIKTAEMPHSVSLSLCRPIHDGSVCQAGEHASKLSLRQHPSHWHRGPAGLLSSASPTLLPSQHQHGLPAQCQVTDPGTSAYWTGGVTAD